MPSTKREDDIERNYVQHSELNGRWVPKWVSPGTPGVTDRISFNSVKPLADYLYSVGLCKERAAAAMLAERLMGQCIKFVELKTAKGKLRPRQKRIIKKLRERGFTVEIVRE